MPGYPPDLLELVRLDLAQREEYIDYPTIKRMAAEAPPPRDGRAALLEPGIVMAQAIGRVGNWFNQELYGKPTTVPWALEIYERSQGVSTGRVIGTYHPTFLYELLWDVLVVIILLVLDKKLVLGHGRLFASYVALYCL